MKYCHRKYISLQIIVLFPKQLHYFCIISQISNDYVILQIFAFFAKFCKFCKELHYLATICKIVHTNCIILQLFTIACYFPLSILFNFSNFAKSSPLQYKSLLWVIYLNKSGKFELNKIISLSKMAGKYKYT